MSEKLFDQKQEPMEVTLAEVSYPDSNPVDDANTERRLVRKLDYHVLPPLTLLYLMSYLDRTNIGNAVIFGLKKDIGLVGNQYNTALAIFFACYIAIEPPSNMALKRSRASVYLTVLTLCTAVCGLSMGFVRNFAELTAVRAMLGISEGGLWPGIMFIIGQWYPRQEAAFRNALIFSGAGASGVFGGLLARVLEKMDGVGGLAGWRWIFIIEGLATVAVAVAMYFYIHDSPATAKFLSAEEKELVTSRLVVDGLHMPTTFKWKYVRDVFLSPLVLMMMVIQFGTYIGVVSFTTFAPTIVNAMGFNAGLAQLLTVPPYILGCLSTILIGYLSDKSQLRFPYVMGCTALTMVGYLILRFTANIPAQYVACCLVCIGCLPLIPLQVAWNANNQGGTLKRAVAIALQVGASNSGGIVASYVFIGDEAPRYRTGHSTCAGFMGITLAFSALAAIYIIYQNKKRDKLYGHSADILATLSTAEIEQEREKGDFAKWWRYTL